MHPADEPASTAHGAHHAHRVLLVLRSALGWLLVVAALWFVWPSSLGGCTTLTVVSGHSMEPTYFTGDLVVARCGAPRVGDIVVYHPPGMGKARVIHRLVGGDGASGWTVKGDNNTFVDPFVPTDADVIGIAVLHIPKVGRVSAVLLSPLLWLAVLLAAAVVLIWPPDPETAATDEEADDVPAAPGEPGPEPGEPVSPSKPDLDSAVLLASVDRGASRGEGR